MDMADKFKLAKNIINEAAPLAILGVKEIKDRDIIGIADVHRLDHGEGCRLRVVRKRSDVPTLEEKEECAMAMEVENRWKREIRIER
jgi:hypothetical protein